MHYTNKNSIFDDETTYRLDSNSLSISTKGKEERSIPYPEIESIQLIHRPRKNDWAVYCCKILSKHGDEIEICNKSIYGIFKTKNNSNDYNIFIKRLHQILTEQNSPVEYLGGWQSRTYFIIWIIATIFWLGIAILIIRYAKFSVFVGLLIPSAWLIWLTINCVKNRPVKYNPMDIPGRLLPR